MTLQEFSDGCHSTNNYSEQAIDRGALFAGLAGEAGEANEQYKKMLRDDNCQWTQKRVESTVMEVMDCMWYCLELVRALGYTPDQAASMLLEKLAYRQKHDLIHGEGSDRK